VTGPEGAGGVSMARVAGTQGARPRGEDAAGTHGAGEGAGGHRAVASRAERCKSFKVAGRLAWGRGGGVGLAFGDTQVSGASSCVQPSVCAALAQRDPWVPASCTGLGPPVGSLLHS